jgi:hypothetical protein
MNPRCHAVVASLPAAAVLFPAALPTRGRQANEESFQ